MGLFVGVHCGINVIDHGINTLLFLESAKRYR